MKTNLSNLMIVTGLLSSIYAGCGGIDSRMGSESTPGPTTSVLAAEEPMSTLAAKLKRTVTLDIDNGACTARFDEHPNGTARKGSLAITTGEGSGPRQCKAEETDGSKTPLTISGKKVVAIGPVQFVTEGSCRYCYVNSTGGMSCVVYNVTPCPS
jgi:hypothetical protein